MYDYLVVGAGVSGITIAERFASMQKKVLLIDKRAQIGGNCFDYEENGILVQKYGPHIFHTKNEEVFKYLSQFTEWTSYKHKVIAFYRGKYYPIPINRDTINLFFGIDLKDEAEVMAFLEGKKERIDEIKDSRDVVISKFGFELYDAFVKSYTKKQWGVFPEELDKSVLERLPIRYDTNPYYFDDPHQGMPKEGFTKMFLRMLDNKNIIVKTNCDFFSMKDLSEFKKIIFTGRLDQYFNYKYGKLDYRCLSFELEKLESESFLPNSVVNYTDHDVSYTRISEFKKFYDLNCANTVICKEYSSDEGEPSYPVMNKRNNDLLKKYLAEADKEKNTYFLGRLGRYKYFNIDKAVEEALNLGKEFI